MADETDPTPSGSDPDGEPKHAELELILGNARTAFAEIASLKQVAETAAAGAELGNTKAAEHLKETESKREAAAEAEVAIRGLAEKSAKASADINDGAAFASTAKEQLTALMDEAKGFAESAKQYVAQSSDFLNSLKTELDEINQKRATVDPLIAEIVEHDVKVKAITAAAQAATVEVDTARDAAKLNAEQSAIECKNVQDGRAFIEDRRTEAQNYATEAKAKLDEITAAVAKTQAELAVVQGNRAKTDSELEEITASATKVNDITLAAQENQDTTAALAEIANVTTQRVDDYESQLTQLQTRFSEMHEKIESLLPGAASAGLAASFHAQKDKYAIPKSIWNMVFIVALMGIAGLTLVEIAHHWSGATPNYDEIIRSLLTRLPIVLALVWLALHAAVKSRIANQIQEDYTYKEAVSRAFEGYKKEFAGLPDKVDEGSPLATLCQSMVTILASSPSRVYDKHAHDPTPMSALAEVTKQVNELVKELKLIKPKIEIKADASG